MMIEGVQTKNLTRHVDERGYVMEILRSDEAIYQKFGQVYISASFPGLIKAWHCHKIQTDYFCCIAGNLKIGMYDGREDSPTYGETQTIVIGELSPMVVSIPPGVWHGFRAVGNQTAVVVNIPTEVYRADQPDELRIPVDDPSIPYTWDTKGW
jgi:dTDP-4-dehydrorhamnose 3,5-epimerase